MERSESIKNLAAALIVFHVKVDKIPKDASNPFFKSKYASLSNILEGINDPLNEADLTFCQFPCGEHGLNTIIIHSKTGEFISEAYEMKPVKDDPQGRGSAITYQRRYALASVLGLNIDDDDDANEASKPAKESQTNGTEEKPWLNKKTPQYNAVIKRLNDKTTTIAQVQEHYKLSKEIRAELEAAVKNENLNPVHQPAPF